MSRPQSPLRRRVRTPLPLLLLGLLAACGGPAPRDFTPYFDLIDQLPLAQVRRETGRLDLGTPAARAHLRGGWSWDEKGADGETFVWSSAAESQVVFFLTEARDLPVSFRARPYFFLDEPQQEVTFLVNDREAGKVTLERGFHDYRLEIPAGALREGDNRLVLRYGFTRVPRELTNGMDPDARRLGVLWDSLRFETGVDPRAQVRATGSQLYIPYGVRVDYFTRFPGRAVLLFERLQARGDEAAALRVSVRTESDEEGAERVAASPEAGAVALPAVEQPVRVSLTAVPPEWPERPERPEGAAVPAASGVVLTKPALGAARGAGGEARRAGLPAAEAAMVARRPGQKLPNVIVYMVDTLRADRLGCYGYDKPVSPHVDAFAREATLFETAVAQSPWTRPSVASIFTGVWPRTHGVNDRKDALSQEALTLAEMLRSRGYRTAGFATNGNVAKAFGLAQGFDTYELLPRARQHSRFVHARAAEWIGENAGRTPFFLYLHTVDPHSPYRPEDEYRRRFAPDVPQDGTGFLPWLGRLQTRQIPVTPQLIGHLLALYDAEIAQNDASFGALVDLLRRRGLWDDTVIVFVSDHGEEFHDHGGWEHGKTLYAEMLQVPLILRFPGVGEGKRVTSVAQHIDLVPTLLTYLGLPLPPHLEGRDLLPAILGDGEAADAGGEERAAFSYMEVDGHRGTAAVTGDWHFIDVRAPAPAQKLYQRREDPAQRRNLTGESPVARGYLHTLLEMQQRQRRQTLRPGEGVLDEELREQLKALGYIH